MSGNLQGAELEFATGPHLIRNPRAARAEECKAGGFEFALAGGTPAAERHFLDIDQRPVRTGALRDHVKGEAQGVGFHARERSNAERHAMNPQPALQAQLLFRHFQRLLHQTDLVHGLSSALRAAAALVWRTLYSLTEGQ